MSFMHVPSLIGRVARHGETGRRRSGNINGGARDGRDYSLKQLFCLAAFCSSSHLPRQTRVAVPIPAWQLGSPHCACCSRWSLLHLRLQASKSALL